MNCLNCNGELEFNAEKTYARCKICKDLFMNFNDKLQEYEIDPASKPMIEQSLGFSSNTETSTQNTEPPKVCLACKGDLENIKTDDGIYTRCSKCGILSQMNGLGLIPVVVQAPGGGWNVEFQAVYEEKLGFTYKLRKNPIGIPE